MTKAIGQDWSEFDALQFWVYPDGKAQKLVIQVTTNGEDFEVFLPELAGTTEPQLVKLKFSDFVGKNGGTIDLSSVERFGIWCNTIVPEGNVGKWTVESTIYFDSIKAIDTTKPQEPSKPGTEEPSNPGAEEPSSPGASEGNGGNNEIEDIEVPNNSKDEGSKSEDNWNLPNTGGVSPIIPLTLGSALIYMGSIIRRKR